MNCLFFVVTLLIFNEARCEGSGVSVTIDISMFVEDLAKDVKILDYGVANKEIMSLASGIAMPDNITYASFVWWTDEPEEYNEKYEFVIDSVDPTILLGYLDIPMTGYVPKNQQKWLFNMRCLYKLSESQNVKIALQLKLWDHEGKTAYSGVDVKPSKICNHIDYPACTVYPKIKSNSKKTLTITSINMQGLTNDENDLKRVNDVYNLLQSTNTIISIQNAPKKLQELFIQNTFTTYKFHIAQPRSSENSNDDNGLLILSKYSIVVCDYIDLGKDEDDGKVFGAVISGIDIGSNRIVFLINCNLPDEDSFYSASLNDYLNKIEAEVSKIVKEYKKSNSEYNVMTVYSGDLGQDSGICNEETDAYLNLLELLKADDLYNTSDSRVVTNHIKRIRSEFLLKSNNDELYNSQINIRSISTFNVTSEDNYFYNDEEFELATPNSGLSVTFEFWPIGSHNDVGNVYFEFSIKYVVLLLLMIFLY